MSTWEEVRDLVQAAFQTQFPAAGAGPTVPVVWEGGFRPAAAQSIFLSVISTNTLHDRLDRTGGNPDPITNTLSSLTDIGIQVRAESIFNSGGEHSLTTSQQARRGMFTDAFLTALTTDVAIVDPGETSRRASYTDQQGLEIATTIFDITARAELHHVDPDTQPFVKNVVLDGDADDVDGSTIDVFDNETIPPVI